MTMDTTLRHGPASVIPDRRTLAWLFVGGFLGLMAWEVWARLITAWVLGGPLEPAELVISLVRTWTGYELGRLPAEAAHYAIGIFGYPILYYVVSRFLRNWAVTLDIGVWAIFTAYSAMLAFTGQLTAGVALFWVVVSAVTATRLINPNGLVADCLSWGSFTWFNALGVMAPLAGLPFLLVAWGGGLSFMSYVGHVVFGFVAALVFELKAGRRA
ncbi:hypothetical protein ABEG18_17515 [Alsobacter sp. KACC 23698]|uniref:Uncharacterized protein n=1 Tax=Alsobacter sp. KACC 23698 TaxID=3149229 RepID=A0AAU7JAZ2_9HYPH